MFVFILILPSVLDFPEMPSDSRFFVFVFFFVFKKWRVDFMCVFLDLKDNSDQKSRTVGL